MDIRKVKKLIELLEESNIDEIEIHEGEESVRISRNKSGGAPVNYVAAPAPAASAPAPVASPAPASSASEPAAASELVSTDNAVLSPWWERFIAPPAQMPQLSLKWARRFVSATCCASLKP